VIEVTGWICTMLVLLGFLLNANKHLKYALIVWIVGDIGWIWYDYCINNWSHATLSTIIILINVYGLWKIKQLDYQK